MRSKLLSFQGKPFPKKVSRGFSLGYNFLYLLPGKGFPLDHPKKGTGSGMIFSSRFFVPFFQKNSFRGMVTCTPKTNIKLCRVFCLFIGSGLLWGTLFARPKESRIVQSKALLSFSCFFQACKD